MIHLILDNLSSLTEELNYIDAYLKKTDPQLNSIEELDNNFALELNPFIKQVQNGHQILSSKLKSIRDMFKDICISFGENHVRTKPEDILESISSFIKVFSSTLSEYRRKQERESLAKERKKVDFATRLTS